MATQLLIKDVAIALPNNITRSVRRLRLSSDALHGECCCQLPLTELCPGMPTIHSVAESGCLSDIFVLRSAEFLGESDEKPFRPADVAEPIRILIPDYFAYELGAALAKPLKRLVDIVNGEHHAEIA